MAHPCVKWLTLMGAQLQIDVTEDTTHVIAARTDTHKVNEAARLSRKNGMGKPWIVRPSWLEHALATWTKPKEERFVCKAKEPGDTLHWELVPRGDDNAAGKLADDLEADLLELQ